MSTKVNNSESCTDLPTWRQTGDREWERVDDEFGLVRIRAELAITDAAKFNRAERVDADRDLVVLAHEEELPSEPTELYRGRDETAALESAREYMEEL